MAQQDRYGGFGSIAIETALDQIRNYGDPRWIIDMGGRAFRRAARKARKAKKATDKAGRKEAHRASKQAQEAADRLKAQDKARRKAVKCEGPVFDAWKQDICSEYRWDRMTEQTKDFGTLKLRLKDLYVAKELGQDQSALIEQIDKMVTVHLGPAEECKDCRRRRCECPDDEELVMGKTDAPAVALKPMSDVSSSDSDKEESKRAYLCAGCLRTQDCRCESDDDHEGPDDRVHFPCTDCKKGRRYRGCPHKCTFCETTLDCDGAGCVYAPNEPRVFGRFASDDCYICGGEVASCGGKHPGAPTRWDAGCNACQEGDCGEDPIDHCWDCRDHPDFCDCRENCRVAACRNCHSEKRD
jgi:hypothetical protein